MSLPCTQPGCSGEVPVGWDLHMEESACTVCGHVYAVWGDETYDESINDWNEWWALAEPGEPNPWR